jgi:hypothetical protein
VKPGNSHTTELATKQNPQERSDGSPHYLTIGFSLDGRNLPATDISWVKVFDLADCSACPQVPADCSDGCKIPIRRDATLLLDAKAADPLVAFERMVVSVRCGENKSAIMHGRTEHKQPPQTELARVVFEAHVCGQKTGSRQHRAPKIKSASATLWAGGKEAGSTKSHPVVAKVDGTRAFMSLQKDEKYTISVQVEDGYSNCSLGTPFLFVVGEENEQFVPVYFDAAERVVALFCVGPDGQAAKIGDLQVEKGTVASIVNKDGFSTLTGVEPGELKLKSNSFYLEPDRLHVDERMAQSHVIHASPRKAEAAKPEEEFEEIVLDLEKLLAEDEKAILRILTLDGKLIETIDARRGDLVRYHAKRDLPCVISASVNGRVMDEFVHRPTLTRQG